MSISKKEQGIMGSETNLKSGEAITRRATVPAAEEILDGYFPVLDHGFIALKDYMGGDSAIEEAARVSYQGGTRKTTETRGLIRYLMRHRHTTPTEMCELKFHVSMPIFIARQWIRHRTASVNEMSGRYSLLPMQFYTPQMEQFCTQSAVNKQGRGEQAATDLYGYAVSHWNAGRMYGRRHYENMAAADVARELARIDLPLSTYTQWYWKIDLHNLLHFLTLRCDSHAQWEIRQYADVMAAMVKRLAPLSYEAWVDYQLMGAKFSREEMMLIKLALCESDGISWDTTEKFMGNKREADEFRTKLERQYAIPHHDLDISSMQGGYYFEERSREATPKLDAKPAGAP